jgi:hypothetical protein
LRWYIDDTLKNPTQKPFAPTRRKIIDLFDALRSVTIIETAKATPSWFGDSTIRADELIACENGLIHWPTRSLHKHTPLFYCHHAVPFSFDRNAAQPTKWLEAAANAQVTIESLIAEAEAARLKAMSEKGGAAAAVTALTAKAKLAGMWREKVDQHTTGHYERIERIIVESVPHSDDPARTA